MNHKKYPQNNSSIIEERKVTGLTNLHEIWIVAIATFLFYTLTAFREWGPRLFPDCVKYSYLTVVWGIPHPPGTPLLMILLRLAGLLSFVGSPPARAALVSAFSGAIFTSGAWILLKEAGVGRPGRIVSLVITGTTPIIWMHSTCPEVYILSLGFSAWSFIYYYRFTRNPRPYYLGMFFVFIALGAASHGWVIYFFPLFILLLIGYRKDFLYSWKSYLPLFLIPFTAVLFYLIFPLMDRWEAPYREGFFRSTRDFFNYVLATRYKNKMFGLPINELFQKRLPELRDWGLAQGSLLLWTLCLPGLISLFKRFKYPMIMFLIFAFSFGLFYNIWDFHYYMEPVIWILALGLGCLFDDMINFIKNRKKQSQAVIYAFYLIVVILGSWQVAKNTIQWKKSRVGENHIINSCRVLFKNLPDNSLVFPGNGVLNWRHLANAVLLAEVRRFPSLLAVWRTEEEIIDLVREGKTLRLVPLYPDPNKAPIYRQIIYMGNQQWKFQEAGIAIKEIKIENKKLGYALITPYSFKVTPDYTLIKINNQDGNRE